MIVHTFCVKTYGSGIMVMDMGVSVRMNSWLREEKNPKIMEINFDGYGSCPMTLNNYCYHSAHACWCNNLLFWELTQNLDG